jgi:tRNA-(ms[2]io[6]A)-hydroxylase
VARRLPVIQTPAGEDAEAAERPGWQWLLIGAAFELAIFLPLSLLSLPFGVWLARRSGAPEDGRVGEHSPELAALLTGLPVLVAFALAAWAAGAVVGRFGLRAGPRTAPLAGALGALLLLLLALGRGGLGSFALLAALTAVLLAAGAGCAWLGARFGQRRRPGVGPR